MIIRAQMLMYGKEASNRKQEIDRQHHTIPNKKTKSKTKSIMEMCITGYSVMDNSIHSTWKSERATFPRPANRVTHNSIRQPVIHIPTMPTTTESLSFLYSFTNLYVENCLYGIEQP